MHLFYIPIEYSDGITTVHYDERCVECLGSQTSLQHLFVFRMHAEIGQTSNVFHAPYCTEHDSNMITIL